MSEMCDLFVMCEICEMCDLCDLCEMCQMCEMCETCECVKRVKCVKASPVLCTMSSCKGYSLCFFYSALPDPPNRLAIVRSCAVSCPNHCASSRVEVGEEVRLAAPARRVAA